MKKLLTTIYILMMATALATLSSSCHKADPPTVCMLPFADSIQVGDIDTFSCCSRDATSFLWNFGDGTTATSAIAMYTYTTVGIYSASLTTSNAQGSSVRTFTIKVNPSGGSWTFKGSAFKVLTCYGNSYDLRAMARTGANDIAYLVFQFYNGLPSISGWYTVVGYSYPYAPGQVSIEQNNYGGSGHDPYYSTWGNSPLSVTVADGKISISASNVELKSNNVSSDSSTISFNITQLQ